MCPGSQVPKTSGTAPLARTPRLRWREFGRLTPLNRTTVASVDDADYPYAHTRIEFLRHLS